MLRVLIAAGLLAGVIGTALAEETEPADEPKKDKPTATVPT